MASRVQVLNEMADVFCLVLFCFCHVAVATADRLKALKTSIMRWTRT